MAKSYRADNGNVGKFCSDVAVSAGLIYNAMQHDALRSGVGPERRSGESYLSRRSKITKNAEDVLSLVTGHE